MGGLNLIYFRNSTLPRWEDDSVVRATSHSHFVSLYPTCFYIWTLVLRLISKWAPSASQWQLLSAILCFRAGPLHSSCMILWMNDCNFTQRVLNIHRSGCSAVWLLLGCCHLKLLPSQRTFCVNHTTMHHFCHYNRDILPVCNQVCDCKGGWLIDSWYFNARSTKKAKSGRDTVHQCTSRVWFTVQITRYFVLQEVW